MRTTTTTTTMSNPLSRGVAALCLAALGVLGACSSNDDAATASGRVASGGEPIAISIAPKQGYVDGDASSNTRSTVAADGKMAWENEDRIFLALTFDDVAETKINYTLVYDATETKWVSYKGFAHQVEYAQDEPIELSRHTKADLTWPLGATKVTMKALHADGKMSSDRGATNLALGLDSSNDVMRYEQADIALGSPITLDLKHQYARLTFTGLTSGEDLAIKGSLVDFVFDTELKATLSNARAVKVAADGSLVICVPIVGDGTSQPLELINAISGNSLFYAVAPTTLEAGKTYQCVLAATGGVNPGTDPDLLPDLLP